MSSGRKTKVFGWVCVAWIAAVAFTAVMSGYFPFSWLIPFMLAAPAFVAVPIVAIVVAIRRLIRLKYKEGLRWLLIPVSGFAVGCLGYWSGDYLIFHVHKPIYDAIVRDAAAGRCSEHDRASWWAQVDLVNCGSPVIVVFLWGGFLSSWWGVIYDDTDQISKPPELRSQQWQATDAGKALKYSGASRSLGGHYYLGGGNY